MKTLIKRNYVQNEQNRRDTLNSDNVGETIISLAKAGCDIIAVYPIRFDKVTKQFDMEIIYAKEERKTTN